MIDTVQTDVVSTLRYRADNVWVLSSLGDKYEERSVHLPLGQYGQDSRGDRWVGSIIEGQRNSRLYICPPQGTKCSPRHHINCKSDTRSCTGPKMASQPPVDRSGPRPAAVVAFRSAHA